MGLFNSLGFVGIPLITTVQYLHPSAIIRKLWTGVFHRACHLLRLSSFILDKPVSKELGTVHYGSLKAWLLDVQPDYTSPKKLEDLKNIPSDAAYFVPDGVFVRAPNTDNVAFKKSANFSFLLLRMTKELTAQLKMKKRIFSNMLLFTARKLSLESWRVAFYNLAICWSWCLFCYWLANNRWPNYITSRVLCKPGGYQEEYHLVLACWLDTIADWNYDYRQLYPIQG